MAKRNIRRINFLIKIKTPILQPSLRKIPLISLRERERESSWVMNFISELGLETILSCIVYGTSTQSILYLWPT